MSASQGAASTPQLLVLSNQEGLLSEGSVVNRPAGLISEKQLKPYIFKGALINPSVESRQMPSAPQTSDEDYARQFFDMLEIQKDFEKLNQDIIFENMLSKILFQCLLSGILGFVYNKYISEFTIYNPTFDEASANEIAFNVLQSNICSDEQMSEVASPGISGRTCIMPENFKEKAKIVGSIKEYLQKDYTLTPEFKEFLGVSPPIRTEDIGQNYETLLEMVMRLGAKSANAADSMRLRILKNVCKKIIALLESADIINKNLSGFYEIVKPIAVAASEVASNNSTFASRIKSLVILAAAYNSYGWLFAIIAPFAVPAAINLGIGTVKGIGKIAMLPIKFIKYLGTGFGTYTPTQAARANRDPINRLICIGYTDKVLPGDAGILKIPYYINLNDILDLSEELQSYQFAKRSLLSTIFDGHGVFDLADMQCSELPMDKQRLLSATHPIVTLFGYIADEFTQITTLESDNAAASNNDYEYIDVISQQMLNVVANTMQDNHLSTFAQGPMMQTTICMWLELLHETVSGGRSAIITCVRTMVDAGPFTRNESGSSISSESSISSSIDSDSGTMTVNITSQEIAGLNKLNRDSSGFSDLTVSPPVSRESIASSELSFKSTGSGDITLIVNLDAVSEAAQIAEAVETTVARQFSVNPETDAVKFLFSSDFISESLNVVLRAEELSELIVAEAKGETRLGSNEDIAGGKRKHSNMMSRDAAKMQNKLVSQHRTVNNQKVMQYMPDYDINQRKFVKGRKSKNYHNKKQKTKKRNKKQFKKRQTKKVLRKRRTTKKRYAMNKN